MPAGPASTTDEIADSIRSLVDRMVEAKFTKEMTQRGRELAATLAERGSEMGDRVEEAWRDSRPMRREAAKQAARASRDAARWSERTWRHSLRPGLRDLWKQRVVAIGAAGAAVPAGKELVDQAAARLGMKRREEGHWGAFFLGLLVGAAVGAIAALLAAPKPGRETRRELATRASEVRDELATRARDAEWVPLFERGTEGTPATGMSAAAAAPSAAVPAIEPAISNDFAAETSDFGAAPGDISDEADDAAAIDATAIQEGATEEGDVFGGPDESIDQAAEETAQAINDAFEPAESVERQQEG